MARFELTGFDELIKELEKLGRMEDVAPKMLEEAVPILKDSVVAQASKHRDTGQMVESIKKTKVGKNGDGYFIAVRPTGKDDKGVRNMQKMAYLEYGTGHEAARPVLTKAVNDAEDPVLEKMQEVYDREVGDL